MVKPVTENLEIDDRMLSVQLQITKAAKPVEP